MIFFFKKDFCFGNSGFLPYSLQDNGPENNDGNKNQLILGLGGVDPLITDNCDPSVTSLTQKFALSPYQSHINRTGWAI